jgi:hypothetical protein
VKSYRRFLALLLLATTSACSGQAEKNAKARWAASYVSQCNKVAAADASLARYGSRFCACIAERYVRTFSAVQIPLVPFSKPLRDAKDAIMSECGLIVPMQDEYDRLMAAVSAHSKLAVTAYLTADFIGIDVRGHDEHARQMLSRLGSGQPGGAEITTVLSARTNGKHMIVERKSLESTQATAPREQRAVETFFSDTWIDSDGAWLLQRSRVDRIDTYVNGIRVSHLKSTSGT